jgi:hypothetical protein
LVSIPADIARWDLGGGVETTGEIDHEAFEVLDLVAEIRGFDSVFRQRYQDDAGN